MLEILLFGLVLVAFYFISHVVVMRLERWYGKPLGGTRQVAFFCIFLGLTLLAMWLIPGLSGGGA